MHQGTPRARGLRTSHKIALASLVLAAMAAWAIWSYRTEGLLHVLLAAPEDGGSRLQAVRVYVLGWGALAPLVYIVSVMVEVLIAPIPGTLLYAPAGAIFGGFWGGTLSLCGNVLGASTACWLAGSFGERWRETHRQSPQFARIQARLKSRDAWVIIFLLRLNPLTSSDLVSYAAGVADVRVRHVALGTFLGMLPQCYLQAYLAQTLFEALTSGTWVIVGVAVLTTVAAIVLWRLFRAPSHQSAGKAL